MNLPEQETYTVKEVYRLVKDVMDDPEWLPVEEFVDRYSLQTITVNNDWKIFPSAIERIKKGTITFRDWDGKVTDTYSNVVTSPSEEAFKEMEKATKGILQEEYERQQAELTEKLRIAEIQKMQDDLNRMRQAQQQQQQHQRMFWDSGTGGYVHTGSSGTSPFITTVMSSTTGT